MAGNCLIFFFVRSNLVIQNFLFGMSPKFLLPFQFYIISLSPCFNSSSIFGINCYWSSKLLTHALCFPKKPKINELPGTMHMSFGKRKVLVGNFIGRFCQKAKSLLDYSRGT